MESNRYNILIKQPDGSAEPFDARALQLRLAATFIAAGRREESYLAEDIALAVEYALSQLPRPELTVSRAELEAAVLRAVEENGFPEVARAFRAGGAVESTTEITDDAATLGALLKRFFRGASDAHFSRVLGEVRHAAQLLGIDSASPHLWLELARHYDRRIAAAERPAEEELPPPVTLTDAELLAILPETARRWVDAGVLKIGGVTSLFPSVHFYFMMQEFASYNHLSGTLTELELEPLLYRAGAVLEEVRLGIGQRLGKSPDLPCLLTVPDLFDFIAEHAGGERPGSESLAAELAGALASELARDQYKLSLG